MIPTAQIFVFAGIDAFLTIVSINMISNSEFGLTTKVSSVCIAFDGHTILLELLDSKKLSISSSLLST